MGIKEELKTIIIDERNPEKAMDILVSKYPDPLSSCIALYSSWSRVRLYICSIEDNRNKYYIKRMLHLLSRIPIEHEDHTKVENIMTSSLKQQHRVRCSKYQYLKCKEYDDILKQIPVIKAPFYKFNLPRDIVEHRKKVLESRAKEDQRHTRKPRNEYSFSLSDASSFVDTARGLLLTNPRTMKDYYILINACQILSGRRNYEIMNSLVYHSSSHPWQANIVGICKKDSLSSYSMYTIPLLCPYEEWSHAMDKIRNFHDVDGDPSLANSRHGGRILKYSTNVFGRKLTHTQKRNIYIEMAYLRREDENHFLIEDQSCSKAVWVALALCHHEPGKPSTTQRYQAMELTH